MIWVFLFAAFGAFLIALGQVFYLKNSKNRIAFFMYLNMSYVLVYFKLAFDFTLPDYGHLYMTGNLAGLAAGCLIYFHVESVCDNTFRFGWKHAMIIFGLIAIYAIPLLPFWILPGIVKGALAREMLTTGRLYGSEPLLLGISVFKISNAIFGFVSTSAIGLAALRLIRTIERENMLRNFYFYMALIIGLGFVATFIGNYGAYIGSVLMIEIIGGILGACIFGFYLVGQAFPWVWYERKLRDAEPVDATTPAQGRSYLKSDDAPRIANQITDLFDSQKLYTQTELSLPVLAAAVGCTTHQLSEYLNKIKNTRFSAFVNGYRIEEAKRLFAADPGTTNLAAARACGFSSDTHFHFVFQNVTGVSPGEYRKSLKRPFMAATT